jgi:hypothetical protein
VPQTNELPVAPLSYAGTGLNQFDRQDLTTVALRLVAIYLLIRGMEYVPLLGVLLMTGRTVGSYESFFMFMPSGLYLIGGILLMVFAPLAGRLLLPRGRPINSHPTGSDLQAIAFSVVGVLLAARAMGDLITLYAGGLHARQIYGGEGWLPYLAPGIQLAIGIALFLGARGLSRFWQKLRSTSHGKENP